MHMAFLSVHSSPLGRAGEKDTGGMSTYLRGLSKALGEAGHRVDLFTRPNGTEGETVRYLSPNVRLICPEDSLGPLSKEEIYPHCRTIAQGIAEYCSRDNSGYDLIFSHYWLSAGTGQLLKESWKIPHLGMFHTIGRAKNDCCHGENEPPLRLKKEEELAKDSDLLVVAAQSEKENLLKYFNIPADKIAVVPCGINRSLFKPFNEKERLEARKSTGCFEGEKILLAVGRIEPVKGFDLLIKAASYMPAEDRFRVLFAGEDRKDNPQVAALKAFALKYGLEGRVGFAGAVDHEKMPLYYNAASLCLVPSFYESFGMVPLEALACGTPIAAAPAGVIPEVLCGVRNQNILGCMIEDRRPETWAAAMRKMILAPKRIAEEDIDDALKPFSWEKAASELLRQVRHKIGLFAR